VFVLPGVSTRRRIRSWKVWEEKVVPSFALEVVSRDVDKDYVDAPILCDELGVPELVVFDPDHTLSSDRLRFQVFRRVRGRGLVRVVATNADRVRSVALGCHLRAVGRSESTRLRVATGAKGDVLLATDAETAHAERAAKDRERAEKNRERAEKNRERARRERAERELARVRGLLLRRRAR